MPKLVDVPVLLFPTGNSHESETSTEALREVLFQPILHYRIDALLRAGFVHICLMDGAESELFAETLLSYPQLVAGSQYGEVLPTKQAAAYLADTHCEAVFSCKGDFPLVGWKGMQLLFSENGDCFSASQEVLTGKEEEAEKQVTDWCWISSKEFMVSLLSQNPRGNLDFLLPALSGRDARWGTDAQGKGIIRGIALPDTPAHRFSFLQKELLRQVTEGLKEQGVFFLSEENVLIHPHTQIGRDTILYPGTILKEGVRIGENCQIGPNTLIDHSTIGCGTAVNASQVFHSQVGDGVSIGPFSHIRPGNVLGNGVHVGDFVELKNTQVGENTHIAHLTYLGDADVGKWVNVGCGVAVANYDGVNKYRTTIGDSVFVGCATTLVAPVSLGEHSYTAAGTTVTRDVPADALAVARARQENKGGYAKGRYNKG